jgi:hypothetical protein
MMIRHNQTNASRHDDAACSEPALVPEAGMLPLRGSCPVCGTRPVRFQRFTANLRESGVCSQCGASNRQRQMALVLRRHLRLPEHGRLILPAGYRLFNAESNGALHAVLADAPGYVCSEYWGGQHEGPRHGILGEGAIVFVTRKP